MALANYTDLQASVASWLHRTDLTALIPDFISMAEAKMNGDLNARSMDTRTTLTCVPGATVAARYVALPTDMVEMRRLTLMTEPAIVLEYLSPDQILAESQYLLTSGPPVKFTVIGSNIELAPPPDSAYDLEIIYKQRVPALASNATNWVLTQNPNAYLFGALLASVPYTQNQANYELWKGEYVKAVDDINSIDWHSGSTPRVKAR